MKTKPVTEMELIPSLYQEIDYVTNWSISNDIIEQ